MQATSQVVMVRVFMQAHGRGIKLSAGKFLVSSTHYNRIHAVIIKRIRFPSLYSLPMITRCSRKTAVNDPYLFPDFTLRPSILIAT